MGKEGDREKIKQEILSEVMKFLEERFDTDVKKTDKSKIMMPVVDSKGEEFYLVFSASVPRGKRDDLGSYVPYDGYAAAEEYKLNEEIERQSKEAEAQRKALEAAKKAEGKRVKKAIQNLEKAVEKAGT